LNQRLILRSSKSFSTQSARSRHSLHPFQTTRSESSRRHRSIDSPPPGLAIWRGLAREVSGAISLIHKPRGNGRCIATPRTADGSVLWRSIWAHCRPSPRSAPFSVCRYSRTDTPDAMVGITCAVTVGCVLCTHRARGLGFALDRAAFFFPGRETLFQMSRVKSHVLKRCDG
jgi:hypothetical protein